MVGGIFLVVILFLLTQGIHSSFKKVHSFYSTELMNKLFAYHLFFIGVYYTYASFNPSDSRRYFKVAQEEGNSWLDFFGTGTTFIDFLAYPFLNYGNFNYEMMMVLFGWFGYLGFLYAYLFFRENIPIKIKVLKGMDFLTLLLFLPNMHFWTSSLGKGSAIFFGLMMFAYALNKPKDRWFIFILSSCIVYFIRPHVFLFVAAGTILGFMTGREKISFGKKLVIYIGMIGAVFLAQDNILEMAGITTYEEIGEGFEDFASDRSESLSRSGSGVDMSSYPLPLKLFTFWFRPLFFDAPGVLGLIISMENLLYLLLVFKIIKKDFIKFLMRSPISVKMSLTVFFLASLAMAFVMSNLGIIIRQKSMVMYFLFFVIYYYLAQRKYDNILRLRKLKRGIELEGKV